MSDSEPELPPELVEAILGTGPTSADLNLVKGAFTWRTVDADLMELAFDSQDDLAGVRDSGAARSFEFTAGAHSLLVEISTGTVTVSLVPAAEGQTRIHRIGGEQVELPLSALGGAEFSDLASGPARVIVELDHATLTTPTFVVP